MFHLLVASHPIATEEIKHFPTWMYVMNSNKSCGGGPTYSQYWNAWICPVFTKSTRLVQYATFREMIPSHWHEILFGIRREHPSFPCVFWHCSAWPLWLCTPPHISDWVDRKSTWADAIVPNDYAETFLYTTLQFRSAAIICHRFAVSLKAVS